MESWPRPGFGTRYQFPAKGGQKRFSGLWRMHESDLAGNGHDHGWHIRAIIPMRCWEEGVPLGNGPQQTLFQPIKDLQGGFRWDQDVPWARGAWPTYEGLAPRDRAGFDFCEHLEQGRHVELVLEAGAPRLKEYGEILIREHGTKLTSL